MKSYERDVSHPTGVRGLKLLALSWHEGFVKVAPHWGAWIEIQLAGQRRRLRLGRTPLGCVD